MIDLPIFLVSHAVLLVNQLLQSLLYCNLWEIEVAQKRVGSYSLIQLGECYAVVARRVRVL